MTEYCFQSTTKPKNQLSDLTIICSFILSHPLYFSYFIFFSPYLFKLLSFLSPLFLTTSLLILSLLTTLIPLHSIIHSKDSFFLTAYNTLLENSNPVFDRGDGNGRSLPDLEEFEVYKVVFEIPTIEDFHENPIQNETFQENPIDVFVDKVEETSDSKCESLTKEEQEKLCTKPKEVKEEEGVVIKQEKILKRWESDVIEVYKTPKSKYEGRKFSESFSQTVGGQPCMGSMRKEKEWRRTLACKLFEERHNGNNMSEERMDLLWETYEAESSKGKSKERESKKVREKERIVELMKMNEDDSEDVDENGKFCCLQALKLSAGKSMGMRFSKAFKGIGFLQSHVRKQGRKGYK